MAQYSTIESGFPLTLAGASRFRYTVESGTLYLRQTITGTGFAGTEGIDWGDIEDYQDLGGGVWRLGVRDTYWVMDCTVTATGFSGTEGVDWANVEQHKWDQILASSVRITADNTDITADRI